MVVRKLVLRVFLCIGLFCLGVVIYSITLDFNTYREVMRDMDELVLRANWYATEQTQDIDAVSKQLQTNSASINAYKTWLNTMQSYSSLNNLKIINGGTHYTVSGVSSEKDTTFTDDVIHFLQNDFDSSNKYGYSPLNFGITYLDPVLLQQDVQDYLYKNIHDLDNELGIGKNGLYRVDPYTIDVKVSLTCKPIRIDKLLTDSQSKEAFLTLFGMRLPETQDDVDSNKYIQKLGMKTIVQYHIKYEIFWQYIPSSFLNRISNSKTAIYQGMSEPPVEYFFPFWYDSKTGKPLNNGVTKTKRATAKYVPKAPYVYEYDYILTH